MDLSYNIIYKCTEYTGVQNSYFSKNIKNFFVELKNNNYLKTT